MITPQCLVWSVGGCGERSWQSLALLPWTRTWHLLYVRLLVLWSVRCCYFFQEQSTGAAGTSDPGHIPDSS